MGDHVFAALADPTRRHLYQTLATQGPQTATSLASELLISRQAVAKHLHLLADAGMAKSERLGRETRFHAELEPLSEVQQWIATVETEWTSRLQRLASVVEPKSGA